MRLIFSLQTVIQSRSNVIHFVTRSPWHCALIEKYIYRPTRFAAPVPSRRASLPTSQRRIASVTVHAFNIRRSSSTARCPGYVDDAADAKWNRKIVLDLYICAVIANQSASHHLRSTTNTGATWKRWKSYAGTSAHTVGARRSSSAFLHVYKSTRRWTRRWFSLNLSLHIAS